MIALLLACADIPEPAPAAMVLDEPVTEQEAEGVIVELEQPAEAEAEVIEIIEAEEVTDWTDTLPPEDQIVIGIVK